MPSVLIPMPAGLGAVSFLYRGLGTAPTPLKNNTGFKHQEYHAKSARNQLNPVREIFSFSFLQYQPESIRGRERERQRGRATASRRKCSLPSQSGTHDNNNTAAAAACCTRAAPLLSHSETVSVVDGHDEDDDDEDDDRGP